MYVLLSVSVAIGAGLLMTRLFKYCRLNLPDVTAYLLAGILIGPYGIGRLGLEGVGFQSYESVHLLNTLSTAALGFIAFAIGNEFRLSSLKNTGKQAVVIGIVQALTATLLVDATLYVLHLLLGDKLPLSVVITLGAIATATAPAATLMVVRQYKAKGRLTSLLLPIVALDDAVGLIVFAISFGIARALNTGHINMISVILEPALEIVLSLGLGALFGIILSWMEKLFFSNSNRLSMTITFVLLTVALSTLKFEIGGVTVSFSTLLVCMMLGTVFCNTSPLSEDLMERADKWTAPLFTLFFVMSGAELELGVFRDFAVVGIGVVYILSRSIGKYFGAAASATATKCEPSVRKYLGITLLPQAGVALGMCVTASTLGDFEGGIIRNIILFSVLVYEIVGPLLTKIALTKSGDIKPQSDDILKRRENKLKGVQSNA